MSSYFADEQRPDPKWEKQRQQERQRQLHPVGTTVTQSKSVFDEAGPLPYFVLGAGCIACGAFGAIIAKNGLSCSSVTMRRTHAAVALPTIEVVYSSCRAVHIPLLMPYHPMPLAANRNCGPHPPFLGSNIFRNIPGIDWTII